MFQLFSLCPPLFAAGQASIAPISIRFQPFASHHYQARFAGLRRRFNYPLSSGRRQFAAFATNSTQQFRLCHSIIYSIQPFRPLIIRRFRDTFRLRWAPIARAGFVHTGRRPPPVPSALIMLRARRPPRFHSASICACRHQERSSDLFCFYFNYPGFYAIGLCHIHVRSAQHASGLPPVSPPANTGRMRRRAPGRIFISAIPFAPVAGIQVIHSIRASGAGTSAPGRALITALAGFRRICRAMAGRLSPGRT